MQRLPGIINIYYVLASSLMASITQKALADAPVGVFADTFPIPHIGDAICEMETQFDNNDTLEKVNLIQIKWHWCQARRDERLFSCLFVTFCMQLKHCTKT